MASTASLPRISTTRLVDDVSVAARELKRPLASAIVVSSRHSQTACHRRLRRRCCSIGWFLLTEGLTLLTPPNSAEQNARPFGKIGSPGSYRGGLRQQGHPVWRNGFWEQWNSLNGPVDAQTPLQLSISRSISLVPSSFVFSLPSLFSISSVGPEGTRAGGEEARGTCALREGRHNAA